jgi:dipeptidyl aminopeptidase/acylaminoacyl peptidase
MLQLPLRWAVLTLLLPAALTPPTHAQDATVAPSTLATRVDEVLAQINRGRAIGQVAVSPDGKRLAWIQSGEIRVAPINDLTGSQRITAAAAPEQRCAESDLSWSPDSGSLVFSSDCPQPGQQSDLFLSHLDGNSPRPLTELHGEVNAPVFSPDGKRIAFLYVDGATRPAGALAAMKAPSGVIGEEGIEIQRVAVIPANAPQPVPAEFATPANLHVYEFDWSPDSKSLAYIAADPPGENNWWVAKLYTQKLGAPSLSSAVAPSFPSTAMSGGREGWETNPTAILAPSTVSGPLHGLQIAVPRWSPDGKSIAFIGGLMSDQGVIGGDIWLMPSTGGQPRNLTPNRPTSSTWITWEGDDHIDSHEFAGGNCQLVRLHLQGDRSSDSVTATFDPPIFNIAGTANTSRYEHGLSVTTDRSLFVFSASSFTNPPEIYAVGSAAPLASNASKDFAGLAQLSHFNEGVKPTWGPAVSLTWTNEKFHIQGWLQLPANYDPSKKYPLIVEVHGGPASSVLSHWGVTWPFSPPVFSELGYFVLMPNPRGSYGQGEASTQANRKDFGYGDLRDILAGVDTVLKQYSVDPNRVGLDGWSYGGFMSMFAVTQTHRFRAAVAGAGISNWLSYYGENSIDQWMIPFFGASVYDDPAIYSKSSAINFIKQVQTPTLLLVGDRDGECPAPQSFEFWHALRDLHVPSQLVVYPNEGHGLSDPSHRRDVLQRAVDWFARYLPPGS